MTALRRILCDDRPVNPLDALTLLLIVVAAILGWRSGRHPAGRRADRGDRRRRGGRSCAFPYLADPLSGLDPAFRPFVVLAGLVGAVGDRRVDRCRHRPRGGPPARRRPARHGRPGDRLGARGHPGAAHRVAGRQPPGRGSRPAPGRDRRRLDGGPDDGHGPAAADRDRGRSRRLARCDRAARRLRRVRADAGGAGRPARRPEPRARSPRGPRPARSRSPPRPADCRRSGPASWSPRATS